MREAAAEYARKQRRHATRRRRRDGHPRRLRPTRPGPSGRSSSARTAASATCTSGSLHAPDAEMAVRNARDLYTRRGEGVSIWVVPADAITTSDPDAKGAFFESPAGKNYRHAVYYTSVRGGAAPVSDVRSRRRDGRRHRSTSRARRAELAGAGDRRRRIRRRRRVRAVARRRRPDPRPAAGLVDRPRPRARGGRRPRQHRASTCSGTPDRCCTTPAPRDGRSEDDLAYLRDEPEFRSRLALRAAQRRLRAHDRAPARRLRLPVRALLRAAPLDATRRSPRSPRRRVKEVDYHRDHADPVDAPARRRHRRVARAHGPSRSATSGPTSTSCSATSR